MNMRSYLRTDDDADLHEVDDDFASRVTGVFKNESRLICCVSYLLWYAQIDRVSARNRMDRLREVRT